MSTGEEHPHSFFRDGEELRTAKCEATRAGKLSISSGIKDLLVLKSTGSAFYGFFKDEYTTLPEVEDRIFSTNVDCVYSWAPFSSLEQVADYAGTFAKAYTGARQITFETFAVDNSCSVQATLVRDCPSMRQDFFC